MSTQGENSDHDKEWADMKTGWKSTSAETFMTEKLRWSLRLRTIGSWLWLGLEVSSVAMLAVIAVIESVRGNAAAAAAVTILGVIAVAASVWARRSPLRRASGSLLELIDLTIHRARRSERFAWAQYFTTAACVVFVAVVFLGNDGKAIEPFNDPGRATVALVIFALYAVGVGIYHWSARQRGRRFLALRQSFAAQPTEPDTP